jgi:hypothetical protein
LKGLQNTTCIHFMGCGKNSIYALFARLFLNSGTFIYEVKNTK